MHPDVVALLAVQAEDAEIRRVEARLAELKPRLDALTRERDRELQALARARELEQAEERRQRELQARVSQHRQLRERNESQLESVGSMREATAATAQLDQARRMIAEDERELGAVGDRVAAARTEVAEHEAAVAAVEARQAELRATLDADRVALEAELAELKRKRDQTARGTPRSVLGRYERIHDRRPGQVLFPLRGTSCSHCDTVVPVQRRTEMVRRGNVELCEGCGMLLYAAE